MSDCNPYLDACPSKLKLKCDDRIKKKKKKRDKDKKKQVELAKSIKESTTPSPTKNTERVLTKAELSFKKMQEKMQQKRIMDRASQTHKQRVESFNQHLDNLTEHFDIPKVSWTK